MGYGVGAVIPAAGTGARVGGRTSKAFIPLGGVPLIIHTLRVIQGAPSIRWIVVVARAEDRARVQQLLRRHRMTKVSAVVAGGPSRASSVARGVAALPPEAAWVVVHDGARPCVSRALIESVIAHARRHGAVACGLPASLTVKATDPTGTVRLTLDRDALWFVQTPQAFRRDWLSDAVSRVDGKLDSMPDDAALLEWAGYPVRMISGDPLNIKVTTREDVLIAAMILRNRFRFFTCG